MSIDTVGDSTIMLNDTARQQRKLQEERAAQLKASEERQEQELTRLSKSRKDQLEHIYESQAHEIDARRREADDRVEVAKADADSRLRVYEAETAKMTEEAKRQFQTKAVQLQRAASELEAQRAMLVKQHDSALEHIRDTAANTEEAARRQASVESARAHINQIHNIEEIQERGEIEAVKMKDKVLDDKRMITDQGAREVRTLKQSYDDYAAAANKELEFTKREHSDQLAKERENLQSNELRQNLEAKGRSERLERQTQQALDRMHIEGNRKLAETNNEYGRQIMESEKLARNKIREQANRAAFTMQSMQAEADAQESIARSAYSNQKAAVAENREKNVAQAIKDNEAMQKQLRADYDARTKLYASENDRKLNEQFAAGEAELKYHRDEGRRAVNAQILSNAETVGARAGKAADPFYRINRLAPSVEDGPLETVIRVSVPEHEQDSVRLSHQNGALAISGTRRFQEHAKTESGGEAATSSFQSYSETFPVRGKLEMNNMTRTYADGVLMFRIPKG